MTLPKTLDVRISNIRDVPSAQTICGEFPISDGAAQLIQSTRDSVHGVLEGQDDRLLVVIGPCSIHDIDCARDYADRLLALRRQYEKDLIVIMRVYFEKPRTTVGWKGLINDPNLNGTFDMANGLMKARNILIKIGRLGLAAGTEFLDPFTPQYLADLVELLEQA